MLVRDSPGSGRELFWVRRGDQLRFSAGFFAFPGGALDRDDAAIAVRGTAPESGALVAAAARELFEETGVLAARLPRSAAPGELEALRHALLGGSAGFAEVLARLGAELVAGDFVDAGRWITPDFSPRRFETRFFLVRMPPGQRAVIWDGELVEGDWVSPAAALERWAAGSALLHPPILNALRAFAEEPSLDRVLDRLRHPPGVEGFIAARIEYQRGIFVFPQLTPTLPPARHTNCYVVGGEDLLVVDPGSPYPTEQERLARLLGILQAEGRRVRAIVLTHHHPDHVGGVEALRGSLGTPVWAHRLSAPLVGGVDRLLEDGELLETGGGPALRALHTPGHTGGHLCLFEPRSRAVLTGDLVSSVSTVVIDPSEGDMSLYLASLDRLAALPAGVLYPGHGNAIVAGPAKLAEYRAHRAWREERLLEALADGPLAVGGIVARAYDDVAEAQRPLAERSALAALIKLEREGRVERSGDQFRRVVSSG